MRAGANESARRLTDAIADAARSSGRTFAAFQYSALGGPLDAEIVRTLHAAHVPILLGVSNAMRALRYLPMRRNYWARAATVQTAEHAAPPTGADLGCVDFLAMRKALMTCGIPIVDTSLARSEEEAVVLQRHFGVPVAVKAEMPGLLHKSDIGCVRLGCSGAAEVAEAYRAVVQHGRKAGFKTETVLVQPMVTGVTEAYAGVIDDPLYGPAVCFGLGGIFVEIFNDATTEMAPLSRDDAIAMIQGIRGAKILTGARGRAGGDIDALADMLVRLGQFALANAGCFRALDLNPIIIKAPGEGVVAVDIALEAAQQDEAAIAAHAAS